MLSLRYLNHGLIQQNLQFRISQLALELFDTTIPDDRYHVLLWL